MASRVVSAGPLYPRIIYIPPLTVPVFLTPPSISGSPASGQTLIAIPGTVSGSYLTLSYQWYADGVAIPDADEITVDLTDLELGEDITVIETATNAAGSASEESAPVGPITGGLVGQPIGFLLLLTHAA